MSDSSQTWPDMPDEVHQTLRAYLGQLRKQIGGDTEAVILYGSLVRGEFIQGRSNINLLLVLRQFSLDVGKRCGSLHRRWGKDGVVAPLIMVEHELPSFSECFPLEFFEIKESHVLLEGRDPFPELHLSPTYLFDQCHQEIKGNLLRTRQRFIEGEGKPEAVFALLPLSLTALIPCFRGLFRLLGQSAAGTSAGILDRLPEILQVETKAFQEVLDMKRGLSTPGKKAFPGLYERYLGGLEEINRKVDALKAEGRF